MIYERDNQPESFRGYVLTVEQMAARDKIVSRRAIERERARLASRFPPELAEKLEPFPFLIRAYLDEIVERDGIRNGRIVWSGEKRDLAYLCQFLRGIFGVSLSKVERYFTYPGKDELPSSGTRSLLTDLGDDPNLPGSISLFMAQNVAEWRKFVVLL
jgi:hypothetical protein